MRIARQNERGIALVLVLAFAAIIAATATSMLQELQTIGEVTHSHEQALKRRIAVDSAAQLIAARLRDPGTKPFEKMSFEIGEIALKIHLSPQSEKLDLNSATPEQLETWIKAEIKDQPDLALQLAHRIVDWRDPEDLRQLQGAEADDYRQAGLDYGPANAPIRHVNELRDIMGMSNELFSKLYRKAAVATGSTPAIEQDDDEASNSTESTDETEPRTDTVNADDQTQTSSSATADQNNVYSLSIEALSRSGGKLTSEFVLWTEPSLSNRNFEILDYEPFVLTRASE